MFGLGKRKELAVKLKAYEAGQGIILPITMDELPDEIAHYITELETGETAQWCKCLWRTHPDDQQVKKGHCRICKEPPNDTAHRGLPEDYENEEAHHFRGIRRTKVDEHPLCPACTPEGRIVGFIEWVRNR